MKKVSKEDFTISCEQGRFIIRFKNQIKTNEISFDYTEFTDAIRAEIGTNSL